MSTYIATFHTHLAALLTSRTLMDLGISARMMPVPRKLSSSCGTCVRYESGDPAISAMDEDVEGVYELLETGEYFCYLQKD